MTNIIIALTIDNSEQSCIFPTYYRISQTSLNFFHDYNPSLGTFVLTKMFQNCESFDKDGNADISFIAVTNARTTIK